MIRHVAVATLTLFIGMSAARAAEPELPPGEPPQTLEPGAPDVTGPAPPPPPKPTQSEAETQSRVVDELLGRLAKTDDPRTAKRIANAVQALWLRSGSDTVDLLTSRSIEAQREQKLDIALKLMDEIVSIKPDYAEGWNRRATLHFLSKDYDSAMVDLRETLIREPRNFGAWVGLGRVLQDAEINAKALAAYRKALEIYPQIEGLKKQVDELTLKVEGQPI